VAIRACLDANVYVSYLLDPLRGTPPATIFRAGLRHHFTIVFGDRVIEEVLRKVSSKPYLRAHISLAEADELVWFLREAAEFVDEPDTIPTLRRDPKDNYQLAYSAIARVDFLVSGDHDLLALGAFEGVRIVCPAAFAALLDEMS
jgi:putative PIN family toxin of toxin-antitoxin system